MKKVLLIANAKYTVTNFRGELLDELKEKGHDVKIVAPLGEDLDGSLVTDTDVIPVRMDRNGINPKNDFRMFIDLVKIMLQERPDIVLNYTIKPVIYGSLAAGLFSKAKIFSNITGLGYIFTDQSRRVLFLKKLVVFLYKLAIFFNDKVFFQNPDDLRLFTDLGILSVAKTKRLNGSGINLQKFSKKSPENKQSQSFLFVGRLLKDKGILELIQAFKIVRQKFPNAILTIAGEQDINPNSISSEQLKKWQSEERGIYFVGRVSDVVGLLRSHQVMVLPSYREGTPRSLLEAMASSMPVITTDAPGCRETVIPSKTGFIVPVKDHHILAEKMMYFIENPQQIQVMGDAALVLASEKYDVQRVNQEILEILNL